MTDPHAMEEESARKALEAAATFCDHWAARYFVAAQEAKHRKAKSEFRDFETMSMACAFRRDDIAKIDPSQFRSDRHD